MACRLRNDRTRIASNKHRGTVKALRMKPLALAIAAAGLAMAVGLAAPSTPDARTLAAAPPQAPVAAADGPTSPAADGTFLQEIRPLLENFCTDCHDADRNQGGLDLARFTGESAIMADRSVWAAVYEKVESHQMPPPKRRSQPTQAERARLLAYIAQIAARPDPSLAAVDPGKPLLRRLTRLEYNNTVRDVFGLEIDLFMFPERLPLSDKGYFKPATGTMGDEVRVPLREFGGKHQVLLGQAGLPGDNRAEHGYRNRGEAMNLSPLLLEKYLAVAGEIVHHPELPQRSAYFAELLGIDPATLPPLATRRPGQRQPVTAAKPGSPLAPVVVVKDLAPTLAPATTATGSAATAEHFKKEVAAAFAVGLGGVYDVPSSVGNTTVAGKGGMIRVQFGPAGRKSLEINPNSDLWLVSFASAQPTSANLLIANKVKGEKVTELTFGVEDGDEDEGVAKVGVVVLGRKGQTGPVKLTVTMTDGTQQTLSAELAEGSAGNTFFAFAAVSGESIKRLKVDGSATKGDYLLMDDLAFVTNGTPAPKAPASTTQPAGPVASPVVNSGPAQTKPAQAKPAEVKPAAKLPSIAKLPPRDRLATFVDRSFRRPASTAEVDRYFAVFTRAKSAGKSEQDAMRLAAQAVLASPSFLYLSEPVTRQAGNVRPLDDFELASRLSYFLWASTPDPELLDVARNGRLKDPAVLEAQTRRMLRDPKARELSEAFATQWLRLDQLYTAKPDKQLFKAFYAGPQGKNTLHGSMLVEALLLFETVMVEDRSILDFIGADYTWLNPRLAKLYHVPFDGGEASAAAGTPQSNREVRANAQSAETQWKRVKLPDPNRGGFLTMAGPLTVTSLPFRTSPVKRGAWLLETIFNRPPTEPKVAFVLKDDTKEAATAMSVRQKFEEHRSNPNCYSCHVRLDPPGFALESFDPIGAWREKDGPDPIDAAGEWNGQPFQGPAGFKKVLMSDPSEFTRGYIEHTLSYAVGRKLEVYDMPAVTAIQRAAAEDGNRFSRVIVEVVNSYPFRHTRNTESPTQQAAQ